jgi:hypothetical protein
MCLAELAHYWHTNSFIGRGVKKYELSKQRYVSPYNIACIYAGLNDKDQAFEWLERAYQERSFFVANLKAETVLDNLRPDPRFKHLLKRINLPD